MKERGHDMPAVSMWREVKEQAAGVARVAEELAGQVRDWIDRTAERLRSSGPELATEAGGIEERPADLAVQMREAWQKRQGQNDRPQPEAVEREIEEPRSLADRMRAAAKGIDRDTATAAVERLTSLREGREAERQQKAQQEREAECQRQQDRDRSRGRGRSRGMDMD